MKLVFIGEDRSPTAKRMQVRWEDGRLAAKPLFEALRACGVEPTACRFFNLFENGGMRLAHTVRGVKLAMGKRVQRALAKSGLSFIPLVHPAARGKIRLQANYHAEVKRALLEAGAIERKS